MQKLPISKYQEYFCYKPWLKSDSETVGRNPIVVFKIKGELNTSVLNTAIFGYMNACEAARSYYIEEDGSFFQVICDPFDSDYNMLEEYDLSHLNLNEAEISAQKIIGKISTYEFDLKQLPLFKFALIRISDRLHYFIIYIHHMIADAETGYRFVDELSKRYNTIIEGKEPIDPPHLPMLDYLKYEKKLLDDLKPLAWKDFWSSELIGTPKKSDLKPIKLNATGNKEKYLKEHHTLNSDLSCKIFSACKREETTPYRFLAAAWAHLISQLSGKKNIALYYPINIRPKDKIIPGCFINVSFLVFTCNSNFTVSEFIRNTNEKCEKLQSHRTLPYLELLSYLNKSDLYQQSPFIGMVLTNLNPPPLNLAGCECTAAPRQLPHNSELTLLTDIRENIVIGIDNSNDLYDQEGVLYIRERFISILDAFVSDEKKQLKDITI